MVGGAAACIGLLAEMNVPDAHALSILLPGGNGNATQINFLEGNVIDPQFNPGGNTSDNETIGNIMVGDDPQGSADATVPVSFGGASGKGNVTQVNILSYNIFNPQASLFGNNISNNTTVSNVSAGNGNGAPASSAGGLFGLATGSGNTTQLALLSGNIFNPQSSLFGSNIANNLSATNVSVGNGNASGIFATEAFSAVNGSGNTHQAAGASGNIVNPQFSLLGSNTAWNTALVNQSFFNGNASPTSTEGDALGAFLLGQTGSGNSNQAAGLVSNILNPQGTFGGFNLSHNTAGSNNAGENGNGSPNDSSSTNGGNNSIFGQLGSGNANQIGNGNGSIWNDQLRTFTLFTNPGQTTGNATQAVQVQAPTPTQQPQSRQAAQTGNQSQLTNFVVSATDQQGDGTRAGNGDGSGVVILPDGHGNTSDGLSRLGQKVADAVKQGSGAIKGALKGDRSSGGDGATGTGSTGGNEE